jgi:proteasome beta subunit
MQPSLPRTANADVAAAPEEFAALLRRHGALIATSAVANLAQPALATSAQPALIAPEATTILAFKFADGVLVAGDRRATAANMIVYDRADKVLEIDRHSLMAIAGVPATAWEMARVLEHSFQFYRRTQLQEMSLDGKVRALSKLLRDNLGFVLQGVGVVVPIFATYDHEADAPRLYFYDAMGAQFEATDFAATGSGSGAVRAVLHYENTWGGRGHILRKLKANDAVLLALRALETAASSDSATGGVDRRSDIFPIVKMITKSGIATLPESRLAKIFKSKLA